MSLIRNVRYPLTILFLVVTFVGLSVGVWSTNHKLRQAYLDNARLRYERTELRRETGYLEVTDPQTLHAIALPCLEELTWRWRIYVPNAHLALHWGFDGIASEGTGAQYTKLGCQLQRGCLGGGCRCLPTDKLFPNNPPNFELPPQRGRGILRAVVDAGAGAARRGPSEAHQ
jgi:hypothetical protein